MRRGSGSERRTRWRVNVEPTFHARAVIPRATGADLTYGAACAVRGGGGRVRAGAPTPPAMVLVRASLRTAASCRRARDLMCDQPDRAVKMDPWGTARLG